MGNGSMEADSSLLQKPMRSSIIMEKLESSILPLAECMVEAAELVSIRCRDIGGGPPIVRVVLRCFLGGWCEFCGVACCWSGEECSAVEIVS